MRVAEHERQQPRDRYDVAVIGGGVNGVAIARQVARAGKRTLLVERHDFGSGTTSRSTRIIHGGLRYLEHGEIGLVRESLRERERLLAERPHLVRPLKFVLALPRGRAPLLRTALAVRAGLWLYGGVSGGVRDGCRTFECGLDGGAEWKLFDYEDAQCEFPERLIAEWLAEAVQAGADARNHTEVREIRVRDGRVRGLWLRDGLTNAEYGIEADVVVNGAGPWVDRVLNASVPSPRLIGGVRGSHILLPQFNTGPKTAIYAEAPDKRNVFVIPWNDQLLVGATEIADDGDPDQTRPSEDEIEYLLAAFNRIFPARAAARRDIVGSFAGVRPLPYSPGRKPAAITRQSFIHDHRGDGAAGLYSIVGGKLTTALSLARHCARQIGLGVPRPKRAYIAMAPLDGVESAFDHWSRQASARSGGAISPATAKAIAEWHGRNAAAIVRVASLDPLLAAPIDPHGLHIVAEAVHAMQHEHAVTLADVLLRRVPVALRGDWNEEASQLAGRNIGAALGWDRRRLAAEIDAFEQERGRFLNVPARVLAPQRAA